MRDAEQARHRRHRFAWPGSDWDGPCTASDVWRHLSTALLPAPLPALEILLDQGSLARRILRALDGGRPLEAVYRDLCDCLHEGKSFVSYNCGRPERRFFASTAGVLAYLGHDSRTVVWLHWLPTWRMACVRCFSPRPCAPARRGARAAPPAPDLPSKRQHMAEMQFLVGNLEGRSLDGNAAGPTANLLILGGRGEPARRARFSSSRGFTPGACRAIPRTGVFHHAFGMLTWDEAAGNYSFAPSVVDGHHRRRCDGQPAGWQVRLVARSLGGKSDSLHDRPRRRGPMGRNRREVD